MRREVRRREGGFTLLEVLVAFAIAAAALTALTQGALGGLHSVRVSGHVQEATSRARSRLATLGRGVPLAPGEQEGDDGGGFRWRQRVAPAGDPLPGGEDVVQADEALGGRHGAEYGGTRPGRRWRPAARPLLTCAFAQTVT